MSDTLHKYARVDKVNLNDGSSSRENNDFKSVHMQVKRALSCFSGGGKNQNVRRKFVAVDLPMSKESFMSNFCSKIDDMPRDLKVPVKLKLSAHHLNKVFGQGWHVYHFRNSQTRNRILGPVEVFFPQESYETYKVTCILKNKSLFIKMLESLSKENTATWLTDNTMGHKICSSRSAHCKVFHPARHTVLPFYLFVNAPPPANWYSNKCY